MEKLDVCMVKKIFTIPYLDKMLGRHSVPETFLTCVKRYVRNENATVGDDGVKYFSTFDKNSYNVALFDSSACDCIYHRTFLIGDLDYKMSAV